MVHVYRLSKIPSVNDYIAGLTAIQPRMSELQFQLLKAQYYAPQRKATATQLAELTGSSRPVVNSQYGRLGHIFCDITGFNPSDYIDDENWTKWWWWSVWSIGYEEARNRGFLWEMHPEVAEALEVLGWVTPESSSSVTFPDEVDETTVFREGAVCKVSVNAYERSPQARQRCIAYYGTSCFACGFNFGQVFGELGEGFIHVHHLCPISEIAEEYKVDPVKDLRPVCPNCHAMIHRRFPPLSIEELQVLLSSSKVQPPPNNRAAPERAS